MFFIFAMTIKIQFRKGVYCIENTWNSSCWW